MPRRFVCKTLLVLLIAVTIACAEKKKAYHMEVKSASPIEIARFDVAVHNFFVQSPSPQSLPYFVDSVGDFWNIYARHILLLDDAPYYAQGMQRFLSDSVIVTLYNDVLCEFDDMKAEERELSLLIARYKILFPDRPVPCLQTHVSGLNHSIVTVDSLLSISLDCYLGSDYPLYASRYNKYELPLHQRHRITPDVGEVLLRNAMPPMQGNTLIDAMVYEGRIAFLLSALIDSDDATLVMGYTPDQAAWCNNYEEKMWTAIIEQNHLYSADNITVRKYIQPAPFTATLSPDAPGRVGRWIGWRIVQKYVEQCEITPQELAADTRSAQEVLQMSGYNGK